MNRHSNGDWGDLDPDDTAANHTALQSGGRIVSAYQLPGGRTLRVITEADPTATTILLPTDY